MTDRNSTDARTAYWRAQIDAWQTSDQSQQAFCKSNDLNYPNFGYWLRKFRRRGDVTDLRRAPGFVPVVAASVSAGLSVHLPSGIELRRVNEQNLHLVEQLLARL